MLADLTLVVEEEWRRFVAPGLVDWESRRQTVTSAHHLERLVSLPSSG